MAWSFLLGTVDQAGTVSPNVVSERLKVAKAELALALGLSGDAVSRKNRLASDATQRRLRDFVAILNCATPWAGSELASFVWYRSQPLPSFGDQTAEDLLKAGRAEAVMRYLDRAAEGGFA